MFYDIEIYTKKNCPYCNKAKDFFTKQSLRFKEIPIDSDISEVKYLEMYNRSNGCTTVPQIFINGYHVGGSDDLVELSENAEKFNGLLYKKYQDK